MATVPPQDPKSFGSNIRGAFSKLITPGNDTPSANDTVFKESLKTAITIPFIILIYFLPYFVGFYAIFSDVSSGKLSLTIGVIVGFILNIINLLITWIGVKTSPSTVTTAATPQPRVNDLCGLPGLSWLNAGFVPQAPLFVSAVMAYNATLTTIITGTTSNPTYIAWALWGAFAIIQYGILYKNRISCLYPFKLVYLAPILSIAIGLGAGGLSAYIVQKDYLPSGSKNLFNNSPSPTSASGPLSAPPDSNVGTCSAPNDQDQFVCETYKDGKLVTSTVASS